jgi:hypothetical protein
MIMELSGDPASGWKLIPGDAPFQTQACELPVASETPACMAPLMAMAWERKVVCGGVRGGVRSVTV